MKLFFDNFVKGNNQLKGYVVQYRCYIPVFFGPLQMMASCSFSTRNPIDIRASFCSLSTNTGSHLKHKTIHVLNLKVFFHFLSFSLTFWNGVSTIYDKSTIYMLNPSPPKVQRAASFIYSFSNTCIKITFMWAKIMSV